MYPPVKPGEDDWGRRIKLSLALSPLFPVRAYARVGAGFPPLPPFLTAPNLPPVTGHTYPPRDWR